MVLIKHRVNRIAELPEIDREWGVEIDVRSAVDQAGALHLSHDAWKRGDDLGDWLSAFKRSGIRGPLIVNTKEDGLEERVLALLQAAGIDEFFFLDTALPTLVKWTGRGMSGFAVRLSSHEPPELCRRFKGKADWLWVDCFEGVPVDASSLRALRDDFRVCLVSPELQGKPLAELARFGELLSLSDAICTKDPRAASRYFSTPPPERSRQGRK